MNRLAAMFFFLFLQLMRHRKTYFLCTAQRNFHSAGQGHFHDVVTFGKCTNLHRFRWSEFRAHNTKDDFTKWVVTECSLMKSDTICKSLEAGSCAEFVMSALSKELSHFVRQQLAKAHLAGGDMKARHLTRYNVWKRVESVAQGNKRVTFFFELHLVLLVQCL